MEDKRMEECQGCGAILESGGVYCDKCEAEHEAEEAGDRAYSAYNEERD